MGVRKQLVQVMLELESLQERFAISLYPIRRGQLAAKYRPLLAH